MSRDVYKKRTKNIDMSCTGSAFLLYRLCDGQDAAGNAKKDAKKYVSEL